MSKYYFQITKNGEALPPGEPLECLDISSAWEEATMTCGELIKEIDGSMPTGTNWTIEIQNDRREKLRTITISTRQLQSH